MCLQSSSARRIRRNSPPPIEGATGQHPPLPAHLADLETRPEYFDVLPNDQHAIENLFGERLQGSASIAKGGVMSVEITTLPSGLRIVTDRMPHLETVSLGVWVAAGSRHERPGERGLSHLLEHMAFKGTRRRSARDIARRD